MGDVSPLTAVQVAFMAHLIKVCRVIPSVAILYDHLLTVDQEVQLVWARPWSLAKVLFLWNRYLGTSFLIIDSIASFMKPASDNVRRKQAYIHLAFMAAIIWSMQCIMLFRTLALYKRRRRVLFVAFTCFAAEVVAMCMILGFSYKEFQASHEPVTHVFICIPQTVPKYLYAFWIPVITFDFGLFGLVAWIGMRHSRNMRGLVDDPTTNHVWGALLVDSILYFSVTFTLYLVNLVVWVALPPTYFGLPQKFSAAATTIMGIRLVLNLREAYYFPPTDDDDRCTSNAIITRLRTLPRQPTESTKWRVRVLSILPFTQTRATAPPLREPKPLPWAVREPTVVPRLPEEVREWRWDAQNGRADDQSDNASIELKTLPTIND